MPRCGAVVCGDGKVCASVVDESDERRRQTTRTRPGNDYHQQPTAVWTLVVYMSVMVMVIVMVNVNLYSAIVTKSVMH